MLYIMLWVKDLEIFLVFYVDIMGMKLLCKSENIEYEYMLVFVGYVDEFE